MPNTNGIVLTLVAFLASAVTVLGAADHFVLTVVEPLMMGRVDPIINPGEISSHTHTVFGGSNFRNVLNTPAAQQQGVCTTAISDVDKSNYWVPTMYYMHDNGTYEAITATARVYYFLKSEEESGITPFPQGMRIVSGLGNQRDLNDTRTQGLLVTCGHSDNTHGWLPNGTSHPGGCASINWSMYFPSCGLADKSLDSADHFSHLTWPLDPLGKVDYNGKCPESHPIKYPTILMEQVIYLDNARHPWRAGRNNYVLANGDTTGNTWHADFYMGWEPNAFKAIIDQCSGPNNGPEDQLQKCAPIAPTVNLDKVHGCNYQGQVPDEDIGLYRAIPHLPGCNPLWPANGPVQKPTGCPPGYGNPQWVSPNVLWGRETNIRIPLNIPDATNVTTMWNGGYPNSMVEWGTTGDRTDMTMVQPIGEPNARSGACQVKGLSDTSAFTSKSSRRRRSGRRM